jgi:hypothetical protein
MDSSLDNKGIGSAAGSSEKECKNSKLVVLYQNICSLRKKITEMEVLPCSELKQIDVICLTEHWQSDLKLNSTNIVDFKLVPFAEVVVNMVDLLSTLKMVLKLKKNVIL